MNKNLTEKEIDDLLVAQAEDENAWEAREFKAKVQEGDKSFKAEEEPGDYTVEDLEADRETLDRLLGGLPPLRGSDT
jgi:hypothetical protein